jgi:hypothetical protein
MPVSSPAEVPASASVRLRLAAVARAAALATRGVVGLDTRRAGMRMTVSAGLRAAMVALRPLADAVRARVERDVAIAGLADRLGPVDVAVEDVQAPPEARP